SETLQVEGKTLYKGEGLTFYAPAEADNKLLVAVPITDEEGLATWLGASKSPPAIRRHLEVLARSADSRRQATFLASPAFLFGEGRGVLSGTLAQLADPLQGFLLDAGAQLPGGAMFSLHLADNLFLEVRVLSDSDEGPKALAKTYRTRVQGLSDAVERYR